MQSVVSGSDDLQTQTIKQKCKQQEIQQGKLPDTTAQATSISGNGDLLNNCYDLRRVTYYYDNLFRNSFSNENRRFIESLKIHEKSPEIIANLLEDLGKVLAINPINNLRLVVSCIMELIEDSTRFFIFLHKTETNLYFLRLQCRFAAFKPFAMTNTEINTLYSATTFEKLQSNETLKSKLSVAKNLYANVKAYFMLNSNKQLEIIDDELETMHYRWLQAPYAKDAAAVFIVTDEIYEIVKAYYDLYVTDDSYLRPKRNGTKNVITEIIKQLLINNVTVTTEIIDAEFNEKIHTLQYLSKNEAAAKLLLNLIDNVAVITNISKSSANSSTTIDATKATTVVTDTSINSANSSTTTTAATDTIDASINSANFSTTIDATKATTAATDTIDASINSANSSAATTAATEATSKFVYHFGKFQPYPYLNYDDKFSVEDLAIILNSTHNVSRITPDKLQSKQLVYAVACNDEVTFMSVKNPCVIDDATKLLINIVNHNELLHYGGAEISALNSGVATRSSIANAAISQVIATINSSVNSCNSSANSSANSTNSAGITSKFTKEFPVTQQVISLLIRSCNVKILYEINPIFILYAINDANLIDYLLLTVFNMKRSNDRDNVVKVTYYYAAITAILLNEDALGIIPKQYNYLVAERAKETIARMLLTPKELSLNSYIRKLQYCEIDEGKLPTVIYNITTALEGKINAKIIRFIESTFLMAYDDEVNKEIALFNKPELSTSEYWKLVNNLNQNRLTKYYTKQVFYNIIELLPKPYREEVTRLLPFKL